jgi:hypothetical protein
MDKDRPSPDVPEIGPEDFYMEGPNMVFTAAYHLKRGYCCGSSCRHCPYAIWEVAPPQSSPQS